MSKAWKLLKEYLLSIEKQESDHSLASEIINNW